MIEIGEKLNIAERTIRKYKARAYYHLAVFANQVEFIYEKTYHFDTCIFDAYRLHHRANC